MKIKELEELLTRAAELGWKYSIETVPAGSHNGWQQPERNYVELRKISPAGEDFGMNIDFRKEFPVDSFLLNLQGYWDSFDIDEHVETWLSQRGNGGCPSSILELLTDAEKIKDSIFELWSVLSDQPPLGTLNSRFSSLLKEVNSLLMLAPSEEECSDEENQIFSDLANLKESLTSAGVQWDG